MCSSACQKATAKKKVKKCKLFITVDQKPLCPFLEEEKNIYQLLILNFISADCSLKYK